jgi:hypothetical protein
MGRAHPTEAQQVLHMLVLALPLTVLRPPPLQERIKELTDKFNVELDADRQKFEVLLQEKNEQELDYEEKLKQVSSHVEIRQDQAGICCCWCCSSKMLTCGHAEGQGFSTALARAAN